MDGLHIRSPRIAHSAWEESKSYPDPRVQNLDPSFARYRVFNANVERLYTGARWSEGPVWFGDARCLLWSDIPNNRILRWDEVTGRTGALRSINSCSFPSSTTVSGISLRALPLSRCIPAREVARWTSSSERSMAESNPWQMPMRY
jgi:sugar lactone lactonase YvrE